MYIYAYSYVYICSKEYLPPLNKNPKGILHHMTSSGKSVIGNLLFSGLVPVRVKFHEVDLEPKCVVPQDEIWNVKVIIRQQIRSWEA